MFNRGKRGMMKRKCNAASVAVLVAILGVAAPALAKTSTPAQPVIEWVSEGAFIAAVPASSKNTAGYFTLKNPSDKAIELVSASSDVAGALELHQHVHVDGRMKMERVPSIPIPAKGEVVLKPKGLHLMLIGLKKGFSEKKNVRVRLGFSDGTSLEVDLPVRKPGEAAPSAHDHSSHGHHH